MITTETIEGTIDDTISFHYDVFTDVLYLRLIAHMNTPSIGEQTDDGDILLRAVATGEPVGLTVVSWWKRFGQGARPDSVRQIEHLIEPLAKKVPR